MNGLQSTVAKLAAIRSKMDALKASGTAHGVGGPARLHETTDFGRNPGKLRMLHHVPAGLTSAPALVVALHGCTQNAASYDDGSGWSTLAERHGFALLMPEQQSSNNPNLCFNWFEPGHTRRGGGEALSIHQMIRCMIANYGVDASRVFIVGLSAGGAMTAAMLAAYPETFSAGAVIAGLPAGAASNVMEAMEAMRSGRQRPASEWGDTVRRSSPHTGPWPRLSVWHGDRDPIVSPENAEHTLQQWGNVHGVRPEPAAVDNTSGYQRRVWRDVSGEDVIEAFTVSGMSHGVPIDLDDAHDRCGRAGPLHFDVGISSATSIIRFWNIAEPDLRSIEPVPPGDYRAGAEPVDVKPSTSGRKADARQNAFANQAFAKDPLDVIAAALRQAGLLDDKKPGSDQSKTGLDAAQKIVSKALRAAGVLKD